MSNELATAPASGLIANTHEQRSKLKEIISQTKFDIIKDMDNVDRTFLVMAAITELRKIISGETLDMFLTVMDNPLGFLTDRPPGSKDKNGKPLKPYPKEVIRDCLIQAAMRGVRLDGNEFNVIKGKCYITKQHYSRVIRDWPGVTDLKTEFRTPHIRGQNAFIGCRADWKVYGEPDYIDCQDEGAMICVKNNDGMGIDALLGKAESKLLKRVWVRLHGSKSTEADLYHGDADEGIIAEAGSKPPAIKDIEMSINLDAVEIDLNEAVYVGDIEQAKRLGESWFKDCTNDADRDRVREMTKAAIDKIKAEKAEREAAKSS